MTEIITEHPVLLPGLVLALQGAMAVAIALGVYWVRGIDRKFHALFAAADDMKRVEGMHTAATQLGRCPALVIESLLDRCPLLRSENSGNGATP